MNQFIILSYHFEDCSRKVETEFEHKYRQVERQVESSLYCPFLEMPFSRAVKIL